MHTTKGFTLIELVIVIAIVGILAAVAVPQYGQYVRKSKFSEVVNVVTAYKAAVSLCAQDTNGIASCTPGSGAGQYQRLPPDITTPTGYIQSLATVAGVITVNGTAETGGYTYVLSPSLAPGSRISWTTSGTCLAVGFCK